MLTRVEFLLGIEIEIDEESGCRFGQYCSDIWTSSAPRERSTAGLFRRPRTTTRKEAKMKIELSICETLSGLHVGLLEIVGVQVQQASESLRAYCREVAVQAAQRFSSVEYNEECQEVRQLLRFGKFKASGRSKPAQEYLAGCVSRDGQLPEINGPVDLLNAVSLQFNLPISLLSLAKCSRRLHVARGKEGQSYVFNSAGQTLDLADLITTYDASMQPARPVGTPIKDSLVGKIEATDQDLVAIVYCPNSESARRRCDSALARLGVGMAEWNNGRCLR